MHAASKKAIIIIMHYLFLFVSIASVRAAGAVVLRLSGVSLGQVRLSRYF